MTLWHDLTNLTKNQYLLPRIQWPAFQLVPLHITWPEIKLSRLLAKSARPSDLEFSTKLVFAHELLFFWEAFSTNCFEMMGKKALGNRKVWWPQKMEEAASCESYNNNKESPRSSFRHPYKSRNSALAKPRKTYCSTNVLFHQIDNIF